MKKRLLKIVWVAAFAIIQIHTSFAQTSGTDPKLSGTVMGTAGSYQNDPNVTKEKVFDGNTSTYYDNCVTGAWAGLDLTTAKKISKIRYYPRNIFPERMVGGKFQASNTADFSSGVVDLATVSSQPAVAWIEVSITNTNGFRYIRYLGPANTCSNVAEVEFYGADITTPDPKLSGTVIGTPGSWNNDQWRTKAQVFDGATSTFFDNCDLGAWAGLDLGSTYKVSKIRYYPRDIYPDRMVGGKFQASNTADFSSGVVDLATVTTQPAIAWTNITITNTNGYRYVRYVGPANGCANVAEVEFYGIPLIISAAKLSGTIIGTPGSWNNDPTVAKESVFDGNTSTYFDNCAANAWAGLDLGATTYKLTKVRYFPRAGGAPYEARMVGGKFQGSNTADFSGAVTDLAVISASPAYAWNELIVTVPYGYRYIRYLGSSGACANVAEVEFYGTPAPAPTDNTAPSVPGGFSASSITRTSVTISWNASSDNVGVTGYEVYRNGKALTVVTNTSFTIPGGCGTTYPVQVRAKDAVGNWSGLSSVYNVTTTSCPSGTETLGGGSLASPAVGPPASYSLGNNLTLVKNWNWGLNGTIRNMTEMSSEFNYHDQFGTIGNGDNYGSKVIAADEATALSGQRVEDPLNPVRQILDESMRTYLLPLDGATRIKSDWHNVGDGGFTAKWELPKGGSLLGQDIVWETRMRYVVPQQYWWAIWIAGDYWDRGAEIDLVEGFGYDNGCGAPCTNFDGRFWHSGSIDGPDQYHYWDWNADMTAVGFPSFDPTQYHVWTLVYRKDNSYDMYCDGIRIQGGSEYWWTRSAEPNGIPIDMTFLFDAAWGHTQIASVNFELPASSLSGKYYEFDYSRVYLGPVSASARKGSEIAQKAELNVYPNPANNVVNISFNEKIEGNVEIKVFDALGKTVYSQLENSAKQNKISLNVSGLGKGMYVMKIMTNGKLYSRTFIK